MISQLLSRFQDDSLIPQNPPWLSRQMVCTLPKSTVEIKNMYLTELREQEEHTLLREMNRTRPRAISVIERVNSFFFFFLPQRQGFIIS